MYKIKKPMNIIRNDKYNQFLFDLNLNVGDGINPLNAMNEEVLRFDSKKKQAYEKELDEECINHYSKRCYRDIIEKLARDESSFRYDRTLIQTSNGLYLSVAAYACENFIKRVTNFSIKAIQKVNAYDYSYTNNSRYMLKIQVFIDDKTVELTLTPEQLLNIKYVTRKLGDYAIPASCISKEDYEFYILDILGNAKNIPTVITTNLAGYNNINNVNYFVANNKTYKYFNNPMDIEERIYLADSVTIKPNFTTKEQLLEFDEFKDIKNLDNCDELLVNKILCKLCDTLYLAYNQTIEPFLVIGSAFLTVYLKNIFNDFAGIPLNVLYGEAASGKSNLLRLIASAYGLNASALSSGIDTVVSIIQSLEYHSNIPKLIDEVEVDGIKDIKNLIKAIYGQNQRKKFNYANKIRTTAYMNTNHKFLYDLEYRNRCLEFNFAQENFNCKQAEKFNQYQQYLSFVIGYIIEHIDYNDLKSSIIEEEQSETLAEITDIRMRRNLAIMLAGFKLLLKLTNSEKYQYSNFEKSISKYIKDTQNIFEEDVDRFICVLKELLFSKGSKLHNGRDYKKLPDGIHLLIAKKNKLFEQEFKHKFRSIFDNVKPLELKAYAKLLKKYGAESNNSYYQEEHATFYGLYIPYDKFAELNFENNKEPEKLPSNNFLRISKLPKKQP